MLYVLLVYGVYGRQLQYYYYVLNWLTGWVG